MRRRLAAAAATGALGLAVIGAGAAYAASTHPAGGPVIVSPSPGGPYFTGPVNVCVDLASEGTVYVELHSDTLGNCAHGYAQLTINADPSALAPTPTGTPSS